MQDSTLDQKRIVILGGSSGIGLATATRAAAAGAAVIVASSSGERVDAALAQLPVTAEGYVVDLRSDDATRDLFDRLGPIDHLAYTAGESLQLAAIAGTDLADARSAFEIRFWGAYSAVKHAAPHLRAGGSIVLSSGSASTRPHPTWSVASSICGATEALTRALAVELAPIRVNAVAPGVVRSDLWRGMSEGDRASMYGSLSAALPVGRVGEVDDVARTFVYLMENGYSTGTIVTVDGGTSLV
jgi:NAD(P)-dependent dehydrogenase (short-subunit alcohol dehydrogenase family)